LSAIGAAVAVALGGSTVPAHAQDDTARGLETIVVTAQKRSESLDSVPATISAVTGADLTARGVTSTLELAHYTPGLTIGRTATWTNFYMRGIGNSFNTPAAQSPVAMYIDGVYQADAAAMAFGLQNVERIEVVKGPQGTLYGRNALGGAINVITLAPTKELSVKVRATAGNLGNQQYSGYISGGGDLAQANLAADYHVRDGYYKNIAPGGRDLNDIDDVSARGKIRFTPFDALDMTLSLDYSEQNGSGPAVYNQPFKTPWPIPTAGLFGGILPTKDWQTSATSDLSGHARDKGASLNARYHFGSMDLVSITASREFKNDHGVDFDGSNPTVVEWRAQDFHTQFSQEFQLLSTGDTRLSWITGLYYLHDDAGFEPLHFNNFADYGGVFIDLNTAVKNDSYAAYAEGTYKFTDAWALTVGGRYSKDKLEHYESRQTVSLPAPPMVVQDIDSSGSKADFDAFTPRISLTYQRPEGLYYLTASQGYSAGLYNITNIAPTRQDDKAIKPQNVDAVELGAKWQLFDNTVHLNVAGFYYEIQDLQTMQIAGSGLTSFENANAKSQGIDADILWAATRDLTLRAAFEVLDATYTKYKSAAVWEPNLQQGSPASCGGAPGTSAADAECLVTADLKGEDLVRSPKFTSILGFDWNLPFVAASSGAVVVNGNWYHSDDFRISTNGTIVSPSYDSFNASLTYTSQADTWSASLWGNNLSDAKYFINGASGNYGDLVTLAEPRTYGVTFSYKFGG
jgi:iron complex outermembrane receptor protein